MPVDMSNGYEAIAEEYMSVRSQSGRLVVRKWATSLPNGSSVIDVGSGNGEPLTSVLVDEGLVVSAIDASLTMVRAFRRGFPHVKIACEPVESSHFFNQTFDAALAVGLVFLLPADSQRAFFPKIANALKPDGKLLFSSPRQFCTWVDILTGQPSISLGAEEYGRILDTCGLRLVEESDDEGGAHYYTARKI